VSPDAATLLVEVPASDAPAGEILGAVDAALAGDVGDVRVRIVIPAGDAPPAVLESLCEADPRIELAAPGTAVPPGSVRVVMPPSARPAAHTLGALAELLDGGDAAAVEAAVPGRAGILARIALPARVPGTPRVRIERPGGGARTVAVAASSIGLGGKRSPYTGPPPAGGMAAERAEHLRHRARSATIRARFDRDAQRLTREAMWAEHERARVRLLERRLGSTSVPRWIAWRAGAGARGVYEGARRVWWALRAARSLTRRAWRYARDRVRQRRSPAPG